VFARVRHIYIFIYIYTYIYRTVTPCSHASDGCMEVFAVKAQNHFSLAALYASVDSGGSHLKNGQFNYYKAVECVFKPGVVFIVFCFISPFFFSKTENEASFTCVLGGRGVKFDN